METFLWEMDRFGAILGNIDRKSVWADGGGIRMLENPTLEEGRASEKYSELVMSEKPGAQCLLLQTVDF